MKNKEDHYDLVEKLKMILNNNGAREDDKSVGKVKETSLNQYVLNIINQAKTNGLNIFNIEIELSPKCMLKSARAFIIFNTLESLGDIIYSNPSAEDIEDEKFDLSFLWFLFLKLMREIKR